MKKIVAVLMSLMLIVSAFSIAAAENKGNDFLLLDGLSWETTYEELCAYFKAEFNVEPEVDPNAGGFAYVAFSPVNLPSVDGLTEIGFGFDTDMEQLMMFMMVIDVNRPVISLSGDDSMEKVYNVLVSEGERIYQNRAEVVFSTPEEMKALYHVYQNTDEASAFDQFFWEFVLNTANQINEASDKASDKDPLAVITHAKAWLINNQVGTAIMYGGEDRFDDLIMAISCNTSAMLGNLGSIFTSYVGEVVEADLNEIRFGMPAGCGWGDTMEFVKAALGDAYFGTDGMDVYAIFEEDDFTGGHTAQGIYTFANDRLSEMAYVVYADQAGYEEITSMLTEDLGTPASAKLGEELLEEIEKNPLVSDAEVWVANEYLVACLYAPSEERVAITYLPFSVFTNQ